MVFLKVVIVAACSLMVVGLVHCSILATPPGDAVLHQVRGAAFAVAGPNNNLHHHQSYNTVSNGYAAHPIVGHVAAPALLEPYDPHPHYNYAYAVHDSHTGDIKTHQEQRAGDIVHGQYSLQDPDGTRRTVDYSSGPHVGFNAVVSRQPSVHVNQPAGFISAGGPSNRNSL